MRYVDEYRNEADAPKLLPCHRTDGDAAVDDHGSLRRADAHAHQSGIDQLLPPEITLVHGPGCPVCVTPLELIDKAIALPRPEVILTSFGDMLRVPGSSIDLLGVQAQGGDVRMVYSPLDAVKLARRP